MNGRRLMGGSGMKVGGGNVERLTGHLLAVAGAETGEEGKADLLWPGEPF